MTGPLIRCLKSITETNHSCYSDYESDEESHYDSSNTEIAIEHFEEKRIKLKKNVQLFHTSYFLQVRVSCKL